MGKTTKIQQLSSFLKDKEVISICPEVLAGMETPRPCAEIVNGRVVDENGNDVSLEYNKAVAVALSKIQNEEIDLVILQSRSPTCGVNQIYDGSFTGKLVSGMGLFAKALKQKDIMSLMLKKYKFTIFHLLRDKVPNALRLHFYIRLMQMSMGA